MTQLDPAEVLADLHASRLSLVGYIRALPTTHATDDELTAIEQAAHDIQETAIGLKGMARICRTNRAPSSLPRRRGLPG